MDVSLINLQAAPSEEEIKILSDLIVDFSLDVSVIWCMIAAFNYGRIEGKRELRNEH